MPVAWVPKMNPDRTISESGRIVWDATPVNIDCHKTRHFPAAQPKHQEFTRAILWWQSRFPGITILLSKKDVSDAFKWLWLQASFCGLFATELSVEEGSEDLTDEERQVLQSLVAIYLSMTFGWVGAPGEFMAFTWVIKLLHGAHVLEDASWHDSTPFHCFVLMDDTALVEPHLGLRAPF